MQAKRGGNSGYTKSVTLSPELASLMGSEALPRHEVVKKMWAIIKERNLYVSYFITKTKLILVIIKLNIFRIHPTNNTLFVTMI